MRLILRFEVGEDFFFCSDMQRGFCIHIGMIYLYIDLTGDSLIERLEVNLSSRRVMGKLVAFNCAGWVCR